MKSRESGSSPIAVDGYHLSRDRRTKREKLDEHLLVSLKYQASGSWLWRQAHLSRFFDKARREDTGYIKEKLRVHILQLTRCGGQRRSRTSGRARYMRVKQ